MTSTIHIRPARPADAAAIATLVNGYAAEQSMLPRTPESVRLAIDDYMVAVDERGSVLACAALRGYSPSLAEVAAVAVRRDAHGHGLGRAIVEAVHELARAREVGEVFALTLSPGFFSALGYGVVDRGLYPEKIRRDCLTCVRRERCREVCVRMVLETGVAVAA